MNVLLTHVSRMGTLCWIKCLRRITSIEIVIYGTDVKPLGYSSGSQLVDHFIQINPSLNQEEYLNQIYNLCNKLSIDILITVMDDELGIFLKNKKRFQQYLYYLDYDCFNIFHDKLIASLKMQEIGILIPKIITNPFGKHKVIFRNKIGIGSNGIYVVDLEKEQFIENRFQKDKFLQEYIEGEEFTVDVLTDNQGLPLLIVPRKRLEIRQGISFICQIVKDEEIISICKKIYSTFKIPGISNVQFIKNNTGLYFIELNPRLGGTSIASVIAGFNFTELYLQHNLLNKPVKTLEEYQNLIAWGSIVSRDYEEYIFFP